MSNYLTKPYEISLWEDSPNGAEVKICTIGTDTMKGQNRAFEPIFSRNVNGVKKLNFKIYKKYVDTQTGEEVDNPYMSYLISERKVKLHLLEEPSDNEWHDFIIKNVSENSATHLCTYQLEDALVQELSKNGFGVTLDAKLMNNIGTANKLASDVLCETDWSVSENSEAFVQTVDEALVYITIPANTKCKHILGQVKDEKGIYSKGITDEDYVFGNNPTGYTALAFYSSCTGKPHRFQFLYSANGYNTEEELKNYISNEADYQYYIEFDNPENDYSNKIQDFYLPAGFNTTTVGNSVLCTDYRGRRYGFSQQAKYIPVLDRYVQLYNKVSDDGEYIEDENGDKVVYYGYEHAEYKSPALTQNMISNSTFESTSGWTGTKSGAGNKATVEAVYGYFSNDKFVSAIDELKNGTFDPEKKPYKSYLRLDFDGANSTVINSGPFDNRTLIGNMVIGDEWALDYTCFDETGKSVKDSVKYPKNPLTFSLGEYKYFSGIDGYSEINYSAEENYEKISFSTPESKDNYQVFTVQKDQGRDGHEYSNESFKKKMNVRLQISAQGTYYLEKIELFKVAYYNNHIIPLEEQVSKKEDGSYQPLEDRTVEKTYYYFTDEALKGITNADQLKPEATAKTLSYTTYKPVYNEGAQKVRAVTTKESNYFNILQSIAETFEAWLTFDIRRNDDGGIQDKGKKIAFKNYVGGNNYACFRYGVNLKDIQRTFESKNIVTKLIVKNNSNEHADGGFCTIQRASANPTGENYIYDFQYFFNQGLMNSRQYLDTLYVIDGAKGPDYKLWPNTDNTGYLIQRDTKDNIINLKGYFPRIKALNNKIQTESELLANIAQDLTKYKADLAVAEAGLDAATSGIEEVREDFLLLTGVTIDMLSGHTIDGVEVGNKQDSEDAAKENGGWYYTNRDWVGNVSIAPSGDNKSINVVVSITGSASGSERSLYVKVYPTISLSKNGNTAELSQYYNIKCTIAANATSGSGSVDIEVVNSSRNDVQKKLQEYAVYVTNENKYIPEKTTLQTQVDALEAQYNTKQDYIENSLKYWKRLLNQLFFKTYSRFIQEGTWISEEYVDDGLYYADAQSVMYNSCYPQVAYTINVISVEGLPGYEDFKYKLGEKTWVVDPDFFGDEDREHVVITEIIENLDDRSKNQIKVQNFKNQFQDLFQKITATVQQAQYSTGSYEKAVALAEANQERKQQFLTDALDSASARLTTAGQQSVIWGNDGITVKSVNSPNDAIRMVGGAILLSKQDENGEQKWVTGVTSDGISASLITAGVLNAGEISIMNYDEPVFRWDSFGISAYDATWYNGGTDVGTVISGVNTKKFVRFDKHGIYGINDAGVDGANWHPQDSNEIDEKSTFALTWEGLKVTNKYNGGTKTAIAHIGNYTDENGQSSIIRVNDGTTDTFIVKPEGNVFVKGHIEATSGQIGGVTIEQVEQMPTNIANAQKTATDAQGVANTAQGTATTAQSTAEGAQSVAQGAKDIADGAKETADKATNTDSKDVAGGLYSWKFSPTEGLFMWQGPQGTISSDNPTGGALFSITQNGLYMRGNGTFTGSLYAGERAYDAEELPSIIDGTYQPVRLYAGQSTDTGFRVLDDGSTYARYMTATQARFGQILFDGSSLTVKGTNGNADVSLKFHHPTTTYTTTANISLSLSCSSKQVTLLLTTPTQPAFVGVLSNYYTLEVEYVNSMHPKATSKICIDLGEGSASANLATNWSTFASGNQHSISAKVKDSNGNVLMWAAYIYNKNMGNTPLVGIPEGYESYQTVNSQTIEKTVSGGPAFTMQGNLLPKGGNKYTLGDANNQWKELYASTATINTSDINEKKDITSIPQNYNDFFDLLMPIRYKFIVNDSDRYHIGFGSQWVYNNLVEAGLTSKDFAGYIKAVDEQDNESYGLRYSEFIALNTWQIQKLKPRVSTLEQTILNYETRISNLESEIQNLKNS